MAAEEEETQSVSVKQLKSGVKLRTGQKVMLLVDGFGPAAAPAAQAAGPGEDEKAAASDQPGASGGSLSDPRWSADEFSHGDTAALEVSAEGAEGRVVRFEVERRDGDQWLAHATLEAKISGGKARVELPADHPDHADGDPVAVVDGTELRFHCELT